jgi:hypothetical protein
MIVEVIALNQLLKSFGYFAALEFQENILKKMKSKLDLSKDNLDHFFE